MVGAISFEASMDAFYTWLGARKSAGIRLVVMDMWKAVDVYLREAPAMRRYVVPASAAAARDIDPLLGEGGRRTLFVLDTHFYNASGRDTAAAVAAAFATREVWSHPRPEGRPGLAVWELTRR